jgi:hypothetical protein
MLAALAGIIHDRQGGDDQQHNSGEDNQYVPAHRDLDGPPRPTSEYRG